MSHTERPRRGATRRGPDISIHLPKEKKMLTQTTAIARLLVKAPRLTPAGVCLWCEARDCQDPACDAQRALSVWAVCEDCDGLGWREDGDRCCFLGIEEITPAALTAD